MLRTGLVEEKIIKILKATWGYSIVCAIKADCQSCNIPSLCDEIVLKCLNYLSNNQIKCLEQL